MWVLGPTWSNPPFPCLRQFPQQPRPSLKQGQTCGNNVIWAAIKRCCNGSKAAPPNCRIHLQGPISDFFKESICDLKQKLRASSTLNLLSIGLLKADTSKPNNYINLQTSKNWVLKPVDFNQKRVKTWGLEKISDGPHLKADLALTLYLVPRP